MQTIFRTYNNLNQEFKFIILSETDQIELPHNPQPQKNNSFHRYYSLSQILDPTKKILIPE